MSEISTEIVFDIYNDENEKRLFFRLQKDNKLLKLVISYSDRFDDCISFCMNISPENIPVLSKILRDMAIFAEEVQ
jgi:hypothetical protein